jgi:hypothetical protein
MATDSVMRNSQMEMARYLRDPTGQPPPAGVERRRLKIYEELVYNNIEGFISGGFPVLCSLYQPADWHALMRLFIDQHRCHTPYFLEISQEFLRFLMENHTKRVCDPVFMAELAHYEWVELALDVSEAVLAEPLATEDVLDTVPRLSPLAWSLRYDYPVHRVGPGFRPTEADEPTFLVVYRDRSDQVQFMEQNAAVARLLELVRDNDRATVRGLLSVLAAELGMAEDSMLAFGSQQFEQLIAASVVLITVPENCGTEAA